MKKELIFKCQINGKWYRVFECVHPNEERRTVYLTYIGRKRFDHCTWSCLGSAIGSILSVMGKDMMIDLVEVWK